MAADGIVKLTLQLAQSTDDEPVGCRKSANRNPIAENRLKPMPGSQALNDFIAGSSKRVYEGGRVDASQFKAARWDLLPQAGYLWASVQTVRGCSKHCSFCSVWRTDGQKPRQRASDPVIEEIVDLRRRGYRFVALADDNFYPVGLEFRIRSLNRGLGHHCVAPEF